MRTVRLVLLAASAVVTLAGCFGGESETAAAARRDGEGRAIGGACRHAGRSIEQCYGNNKRSDKAAVFAGWREMNDYMRENKIADAGPDDADTDTAAAEPAAATPKSSAKSGEPAAKHDS